MTGVGGGELADEALCSLEQGAGCCPKRNKHSKLVPLQQPVSLHKQCTKHCCAGYLLVTARPLLK